MASNYQTFPPSLLTPVNPANSLSGALINNSFPSLGQTFNYANSNNNNNTNGNSNNGMNVSADQSSSSMPMVYPSTSRSLVTFAPDMNGTSYDYTNPPQEVTANLHATLQTSHHSNTNVTASPLHESIECVNASVNF
ncbi:unnamed protein product [Heterobilharzia americana]|nr:unnamed protein product [Heterobilharzia americana]